MHASEEEFGMRRMRRIETQQAVELGCPDGISRGKVEVPGPHAGRIVSKL
jgi:hypothetical protein